MVRAGRPFHVVTDDWRAPTRSPARSGAGRARRRRSTRWRSLRVGVFGYAMNGMGDIRVDVHTLMRELGPEVRRARARASWSRGGGGGEDEIAAVIAFEDAQFEIDPRLSRAEREDHVRMQLGDRARARGGRLRRVLDPLRRDRRGRPLLAPAAGRRLLADGRRLRLRRRGRRADRRADVRRPRCCSARRSSPRCTRWTSRPTRSS